MSELIIDIIATALLSTFLTFISLRFILSKVLSGLNPFTKLGAKLAGETSGFVRGSKAVTEDMAKDILRSPQIQGVKFLADQFGFDLDGYIEKNGAIATLSGAQQLASLLGINLMDVIQGGIGAVTKGLNTRDQSSGYRGKLKYA